MFVFLLILFLVFPFYGPLGEVSEEKQPKEITELFGIKFGDKCSEHTELNLNTDMYITPGKIPNKLFKQHIIHCTGLTKSVWKISTNTIFESETLVEIEMCKKNLRSLEKHFNEKYGIELTVQEDRNYIYRLQNHRDDTFNKFKMSCTRLGTGKRWASVLLDLTVTNLKMLLEKTKEDKAISIIDKKGL